MTRFLLGARFGAVVHALACIGVLGVAAAAARAELVVVEEPSDQGTLTIYKMTVTPAGEPQPALKHRLLPTRFDLRPGNSALFYTRAFAESGVAGVWKTITDEHGQDEVHGSAQSPGWLSLETPLAELPMENLRAAAAKFDTLMEQFVERGAVRSDCDWGHHIEELRGSAIFETLLPEVQEARSLMRAIMLRTRVAIADGDYGRAIEHLRTNYRLAQDVSKAPFLVSGLVGIAGTSMGNAEVAELIAAQDSPNLYWALASLPRPFIDLEPSVQFEMANGARIIPFLLNPETENHSAEGWAKLLVEGVADLQALNDGRPGARDWATQARAAGLAIVAYPDAKRRLIAGGMDPRRVGQMPVGQVIAIDASREYRRLADEFEKGWYLPFHEGLAKQAAAKQQLKNQFQGGYGRLLASILLPALESARRAQVRPDWQLDALQTIEAIRMHAAATGKLPATLEEVTAVPVPVNPATGKPFQYRLDGDTAVLDLPFSDVGAGAAYRYEIKLAAK